jgi:type IV pilus assembly protein PilW
MKTHYRRPLRSQRGAQQGFTLIELSIAVLIGLFLVGGMLTLVQDMRRTFGTQNQLGQLQDNERLAMTLITDVVQAAGYYPDPTIHVDTSTFLVPNAPFVLAGQAIAGTHAAAGPGDSITVQYNTALNDGVINCTGSSNTVQPLLIYKNTFRVITAPAPRQDLVCILNNNAAVTLISGVTNLQILYGVRTNPAGGANNVDTFMTATQMNLNPANWTSVICVKVTLTFTNPLAAQPGQAATIPFTRVVTVMNRAGVNTT